MMSLRFAAAKDIVPPQVDKTVGKVYFADEKLQKVQASLQQLANAMNMSVPDMLKQMYFIGIAMRAINMENEVMNIMFETYLGKWWKTLAIQF